MKVLKILAFVVLAAAAPATVSVAQCAGCGADFNRADRDRVDRAEGRHGHEVDRDRTPPAAKPAPSPAKPAASTASPAKSDPPKTTAQQEGSSIQEAAKAIDRSDKDRSSFKNVDRLLKDLAEDEKKQNSPSIPPKP